MTSDDGKKQTDPGDERVPIYSYPVKWRWVFNSCLVFGTLAVWIYRVVAGLLVERPDHWKTAVDAILDPIPASGFTGVIVRNNHRGGKQSVSELLEMRRKKKDDEIERLKSENRRLEARVSELTQKLEDRNGSDKDPSE